MQDPQDFHRVTPEPIHDHVRRSRNNTLTGVCHPADASQFRFASETIRPGINLTQNSRGAGRASFREKLDKGQDVPSRSA